MDFSTQIGKVRDGTRHVLKLKSSRLEGVPSEVWDLVSLRSLVLSNNKLSQLPESIRQLRNLKGLQLGGNRLTELPSEIGLLSSLENLSLQRNGIRSLPPEVNGLQSLVRIDLSHNKFQSLPAEIGELRRLQTLLVGNNRLHSLPASIGRLKSLTTLSARCNELESLPDEIGDLDSLSSLSLRGNLLTALPRSIGMLKNLHTLSVPINRLTSLPTEIGQLQNLRVLNLSHNKLTSLPREIANLGRLEILRLDGNPWAEPLSSIVRQGTEAVLAYLRSLEDAVSCYEAKVLLVGEGNVGKTSLVAALREEPFVENRNTTHGIEVGAVTLSHPQKNVEMTLNTWDFGGQEVYRITHQFFFSRRSLYLLVWKPREGREENAIEDWLKRIKLRVGDARVIIVATHSDERHAELDYPYLRERFGDILAGSVEVDSKSARGIDRLRAMIAVEAGRLPQMGEILSARWIKARNEMLRLPAPQVPYTEAQALCAKNGVDRGQTHTLLTLLHDLGYIVHYGDDEGLRDVVVLQPEWLTRAISYVLEDRPTIEAGGVLDHARLRHIWFSHQDPLREPYPPAYHPYFLRLMEKFDICYRLEGQGGSLVAQLVPVERPTLPWQLDSPVRTGERELAFRCNMEEIPPGLVAWLTVRNHRFSTGRHWRRGVLLEHQRHQALIQLDDQLTVSVRGTSPDHLFSLVRDSLEYLVQIRWPGLKYELDTPCPHREADGSRCRGRFKFPSLIKARERGIPTVQCLTCFEPSSVSQLLTGFAPPEEPISTMLRELKDLLLKSRQDQANVLRMVMKAINAESRECPRLFSLVPLEQHRLDLRRLGQIQYRLQLWCEHPEHQHPVDGTGYTITRSREWLVRVAPYASLVAKALKVAVPLAAPAAEFVLGEAASSAVKPGLEFMEKISEHLLEGELDAQDQGAGLQPGLTEAEGAGLRELQSLLLELDPSRTWGRLRRVQNAAGDYLWVCPKHYKEYDPGLPALP